MKSKRKVAATLFGAIALMFTTGATTAFCPIERDVVQSYRSAVEIYDQARRWERIARWWVDPEAATPVKANSAPRTEDICQARPTAAMAAR